MDKITKMIEAKVAAETKAVKTGILQALKAELKAIRSDMTKEEVNGYRTAIDAVVDYEAAQPKAKRVKKAKKQKAEKPVKTKKAASKKVRIVKRAKAADVEDFDEE